MSKIFKFLSIMSAVLILTSCSAFYNSLDNYTRYEKDVSDEPHCESLIGKEFILKKDVYLYHINGSTYPTICCSMSYDVIIEKDGSLKTLETCSSARLLEVINKGTRLRIAKVAARGSYACLYPDFIHNIYVEVQSISGKQIYAEGEILFQFPYAALKVDPEYLEPVAPLVNSKISKEKSLAKKTTTKKVPVK